MKYLVANWKSNKTLSEVSEWAEGFKAISIPANTTVVVCPPFPYGLQVYGLLQEYGIDFKTGAQDVSPFPFGAYTGAVTSAQVAEWGEYVIVGHSERRRYFHETHQEIANKVRESLDRGLTPIVCVDVPYVDAQLAALRDEDYSKLIIAYEPLEAIGSGTPDTPEHAAEITREIKRKMDDKAPVLYGGSVDAANARGYLNTRVIDGFLVGGKSLGVDTWKALIEVSA